eukprot:scaffold62693_cov22-Tisochrysis_lutea.AAC.1
MLASITGATPAAHASAGLLPVSCATPAARAAAGLVGGLSSWTLGANYTYDVSEHACARALSECACMNLVMIWVCMYAPGHMV